MLSLVALLFQSSSSPKTGCNNKSLTGNPGLSCSNPHPARRLDAMIRTDGKGFEEIYVPILIQPDDWMQFD